jgi:hypothetical protein
MVRQGSSGTYALKASMQSWATGRDLRRSSSSASLMGHQPLAPPARNPCHLEGCLGRPRSAAQPLLAPINRLEASMECFGDHREPPRVLLRLPYSTPRRCRQRAGREDEVSAARQGHRGRQGQLLKGTVELPLRPPRSPGPGWSSTPARRLPGSPPRSQHQQGHHQHVSGEEPEEHLDEEEPGCRVRHLGPDSYSLASPCAEAFSAAPSSRKPVA